MNEALLHSIWKYKLLRQSIFKGSKGEDIEVISIGEHNQDSGPDFFNSKVRINNVLLVGNVEIHIKTSDWLKHNHHNDKAYDNIILHVVYENDREILQNEQNNVSLVELRHLIPSTLLDQYNQLQVSKQTLACGKSIQNVAGFKWKSWMDRLAITRLEEKTSYIEHLFSYSRNNYEDTLYVLLFRNFGFKINNEPFELLGKTLPFSLIKKYRDQPLKIQAMLFGVAGLLDELFEDKFPRQLQNEYVFLKHKHNFQQIKKEQWKFSKTRPANFPTIRLSQLSALLENETSLYHLIDQKPGFQLISKFFSVEPNQYWNNHFRFDNESISVSKSLGDAAIESIIINTIVPFLFFLSKHSNKEELADYAMDLLSQLPAEKNKKTKEFSFMGMPPLNALESQAQIYLLDNFCSKKRCLHCQVGESLLKSSLNMSMQ
ncbi:MAG: hypothetical protein K0R26_1342 [Bacteroidota bacterium]|jgi:hypothetical protein|nr:hypothetical protein [Bacteroidota bacterium]